MFRIFRCASNDDVKYVRSVVGLPGCHVCLFTSAVDFISFDSRLLSVFHGQPLCLTVLLSFYRAMHFSAKRGIAIACRLSVRLSVTLVNCDHIG